MKLKHLHIENFKGVRALDTDFTDSNGEARNMTALIGDNGSGKTTVLQAIALVLSLATRRTGYADQFRWHGFLLDRVSSMGRTRVQVDVQFEDAEIEATQSLFKEWRDSLPATFRETRTIVTPATNKELSLVFMNGRLETPLSEQSQFMGRYYIKALRKHTPAIVARFRECGDVFWFDQYRNHGWVAVPQTEMLDDIDRDLNGETRMDRNIAATWEAGVERLRSYLVGMWGYHTSREKRGGKDYIPDLEAHFQRVFPGTVFRGVEPRNATQSVDPSDFFVLLERNRKVFDLAEMSSGEQAVFPLVYDFVRLDIAKSVVLIDELELHLHPPQQQALLAVLPRLGPDCQFIVTTHSPYLEQAIPDEYEVRLEGRTLCL